MTVSETVKASGLTPSSGYQGIENADDFIFAICPSDDKADKIGDWLVATERIREHSGSLNATTNDATYIRTGPITTKGNTQRTFSIQGDRYVGDAFQDKLYADGAALEHNLDSSAINTYSASKIKKTVSK